MRAATATMPQFTTVGRSIRRTEGVEKVTGKARFTADLDFPGLLEGRVLRSPFPHALIESIDARAAEALPGVHGVLTRESVKDIDPYYGHCLRDRPLIATDRVRYVGEPVVAVAAETGDVADEALSLVRVRYRELPMAATMDEALAADAPVLHDTNALVGEYHEMAAVEEEAPRNVCHHERLRRRRRGRRFRAGRGGLRGHLRVPDDLPLLPGAPHRGGPVRGRRDRALDLLAPTRSSSAPRSHRCSRCRCPTCG